MLDHDRILEELGDLVRHDHDCVRMLDVAIETADDNGLRAQLIEARADHERHISDLEAIIVQLGGAAPDRQDPHGLYHSVRAKLATVGGISTIVRALAAHEEKVAQRYADGASLDVPSELKALLKRCFHDEEEHLAVLKSPTKA
jgi:rubrerythrin